MVVGCWNSHTAKAVAVGVEHRFQIREDTTTSADRSPMLAMLQLQDDFVSLIFIYSVREIICPTIKITGFQHNLLP